jgi:hydrogenase-4 component B
MTSIQLLILSILFYCASALVALLLEAPRDAGQTRQGAGLVTAILGLLGSLCGIASAGLALAAVSPPSLALFQIPPFGNFVLQLDALSAFLVGLITLIGAATSIYAFAAPIKSSSALQTRAVGFFTYLFMATMLLVVTVTNAFYFLIFWELMTLASYFLVIWETEKKESILTGYIYLLVAHAGAALIMVGFFLFFQQTGSFDFAIIRQAAISPGLKNLIFILAFLGFGAKAGMVPLHFWTPGAYAAAPNHASALMAGVMKKTAVYGILRVCIDVLGVQSWWWGGLVMLFGILSTVIGAFYALSERDIKRLLAYSSVENVGIILLGVGLGMIGLAAQQPVLAVLGFLAALYHMINHAFFKGLLFLGAGSVIDQVGTPDLNRMGGLARRMPWTALAFLIGAFSVSAIPPFNGFVSEWFTYQAFFAASKGPVFFTHVFSPLFALLLALAGAFAVMVYIKAYGGAFTGPARSKPAATASETPNNTLNGFLHRLSLAYLALGCLLLGVGAPFVAPWIAAVAANFARMNMITVTNGWQVFPADTAQAVLSTPLVAVLLVGLLLVPLLVVAVYGGRRAGRRSGVDPWTCGYGYTSRMSLPASGFDQPVKVTFQPLYWLRTLVDKPFRAITGYSRQTLAQIVRAEPVVETVVSQPTTRLVEKAGQWIQGLQMGDIRVYCLYIILTLAILLLVIFGGGAL